MDEFEWASDDETLSSNSDETFSSNSSTQSEIKPLRNQAAPYLFSLPNDVLILILEYFSINELIDFEKMVKNSCRNTISSQLPVTSQTDPYSNLLQLFSYCDGHLFHKLVLGPMSLQWLLQLGIRVTKLQFMKFNETSSQYVINFKLSIKEMDFGSNPEMKKKYFDEIGHCPSLTSLSLASCSDIYFGDLQFFLNSNPQLRSLNISSIDETYDTLCEFPQNLEYLDVSENPWFDQDCLDDLVESLPRLKSINISETSVWIDSVVEFLKMKPSVTSIGYSGSLKDVNEEDQGLLMDVTVRSLMSDDTACLNLGFQNTINALKQEGHGRTLLAMIRSVGIIPHLFRSVSRPELQKNALALIKLMKSLGDEEDILQTIVDTGVVPHVVNLLLEFQSDDALKLLNDLADVDDFCSQMLSLHLLLNLTKLFEEHPLFKPECDEFFSKLLRRASSKQLIPVFSFLLRKIRTEAIYNFAFEERDSDEEIGSYPSSFNSDYSYDHYPGYGRLYPSTMLFGLLQTKNFSANLAEVLESVDFVQVLLSTMGKSSIYPSCLKRCYEIMSSIFLDHPPFLSVDFKVLSSWRRFLHKPSQSLSNSSLLPISFKMIKNCSDLDSIIASRLISSIFDSFGRCHDDDFIDWLRNLIDDIVTVRLPLEGTEAVSVFLDYLVDLGALSCLVDSLALKFSDTYPSPREGKPAQSPDEVASAHASEHKLADCLKQIVEFDEKYETHLKRTPLMMILLAQDEESEEHEVDHLG